MLSVLVNPSCAEQLELSWIVAIRSPPLKQALFLVQYLVGNVHQENQWVLNLVTLHVILWGSALKFFQACVVEHSCERILAAKVIESSKNDSKRANASLVELRTWFLWIMNAKSSFVLRAVLQLSVNFEVVTPLHLPALRTLRTEDLQLAKFCCHLRYLKIQRILPTLTPLEQARLKLSQAMSFNWHRSFLNNMIAPQRYPMISSAAGSHWDGGAGSSGIWAFTAEGFAEEWSRGSWGPEHLGLGQPVLRIIRPCQVCKGVMLRMFV